MSIRQYRLNVAGMLLLWTAHGSASNLTVCGIGDGGGGDGDGALNGAISATCTLPQGVFTGTVTESTIPFTNGYRVDIQGIFRGAGTFNITGDFTGLSAIPLHSFYVFITPGLLAADNGGFSNANDFLRLSYLAQTAESRAEVSGVALPVTVSRSGDIRTLPGSSNYQLTIAFSSGGNDRYFDFRSRGLAFEVDGGLVPEPDVASLCTGGLVLLWFFTLRLRHSTQTRPF